ncbi:DUF1559 domain-containing protein [bacterium]|nr:DUF1559 domain-containing protein [bacterium]
MSTDESDSGDTTPDASPPTRLRGLWSLMQRPESTAVTQSAVPVDDGDLSQHESSEELPVPDTESYDSETSPEGRKSLWEVMRSASRPHVEESASPDPATETEPLENTPTEDLVAPVDLDDTTLVYFDNPSLRSHSATRAQPLDLWALGMGLLSLPLSAMAFWPGVVASLPSAMTGFAALAIGYAAWSQSRVTPTIRYRSACGMVTGLMALLLGPFLFAPWGNVVRGRQSVQMTQRHLETLGGGLQAYLAEHGSYPQGGTSITLPTGQKRGGHGWLTHLLPYINHTELYQQISLDIPYDDPVNRPALGTDVVEFYASGGDRRKVAGGFAVSHFAGVGGTIVSAQGEEVPAGIFDHRRPIRSQEVLDGLANTWIVGEVPGGYAPWGDPENYRTVTKGINKDTRGFGNAAGTGALALMADGSVRFFSNQTDIDVLKRLNTRDAGDNR